MQVARSFTGHNKAVIDEAEVRRMSPAERRQLAQFLADLDDPSPGDRSGAERNPSGAEREPSRRPAGPAGPLRPDPLHDPKLSRERRLALFFLTGCCVILAGWIVVLAATLPHRFDAHHWRAVWVDFDVFLLAAFALTAWALWRQRQVLILLLMITGTMLCCDAWFDVGTSLRTSGIWMSLASAVFAELPLAFLAFAGARRLLKATVEASMLVPATAGRGPSPSLTRTPLSGTGLDEALPRRYAPEKAEEAEREERAGRST
jgi:hypothetical protein